MLKNQEEFLGQQFGNYRIERFLGQGGFAHVYLAEHVTLHTQVAVKVLRAQVTEEYRQDFLREASTIARLHHPNIVQILEYNVAGAIPYLAMTYAPHGSLRQRHRRGTRLAVTQVLGYIQQAAAGLQYAHDLRLIHRDIKPENMLIGPQNEILLSDFGLVLMAHSSSSMTMQEIAGTASYMAPEQFQGKPRVASDQYALGVVAYELLAGQCPFRGNFVELASQHVIASVPPLRELVPDLPASVEEVINRALAKTPQERYPNVQAFVEALATAVQNAPVVITRPVITRPSTASDPGVQPIFAPLAPALPAAGVDQTISPAISSPHPEGQITEPRVAVPRAIEQGGLQTTVSRTSAPQTTPIYTPTLLAQPMPRPAITEVGPAKTSVWRGHMHIEAQRKPWLLAVAGLLLLCLLGVSFLSYEGVGGFSLPTIPGLPSAATSATVTITPESHLEQGSYTLQAVSGIPDPTKQQVQLRTLQQTVSLASKTVNASGKGHSDATYAHTLVSICTDPGVATGTYNYPAGTVFTDTGNAPLDSQGHKRALRITRAATVTEPVISPGQPFPQVCDENVPADYVYPGAVGNLGPIHYPNGAISEPFQSVTQDQTVVDTGMVTFTGGQDAQDYSFVLQSDIDAATAALPAATPPDGQSLLNSQLKTNERLLVSPSCQLKTAADHVVNDHAATVTLSRTFSCSGAAYDYAAAMQMASQQLQNQAHRDLDDTFMQSGSAQTTAAKSTFNADGTGMIVATASGLWYFQPNNSQMQRWQQMLKGMQKSSAEGALLGQAHVKQVTIVLTGGNGESLPAQASVITINIATPAS